MQFLYNENREVVAEKDYSGNIIRYIRGLGLISSDSENAKTYYEPIFIGEVELKAGDTIRLGEVGPNFGYDGGGIQIDLQQQWIGDFTELGKIEDWR